MFTEAMQTPATDFLLFPSISAESSSDMYSIDSNPQSMFYHPDQLSTVDGLSNMDPYSYNLMDGSYQSLSQNVHPHRPMKPFFNQRSPLYMDSGADMPRGMRFHTGTVTPPAVPTPQLTDRAPTPFSASNPSITSTSSSANGSPYSESWIDANTGVELQSHVSGMYSADFNSTETEMDSDYALASEKYAGSYVDPTLINQETQIPTTTSYSQESAFADSTIMTANQIPSPLPITQSFTPQLPAHHHFTTTSPYLGGLQPPHSQGYDHLSVAGSSMHSPYSQNSPSMSQTDIDEDGRERGRCRFPDCGKQVKDLKAHMLTHQSERPEKCPIVTCEYHLKGFARKYDKNRHTLIHYKGTMVCGFCPGSGSAAEKSFNRADVFKRHLTSVHGVELTPPNCRKRTPTTASSTALSSYSPDATGKCSTCSKTFRNAQDFYEHLDDCVLRVVQQEQPSEAINQQRLAEVAADEDVKKTMEKHMLLDSADNVSTTSQSEDNDDDSMSRDSPPPTGRGGKKKGKAGSNSVLKPVPGNNGVTKPRVPVTRRRGNRNNYPQSWGCSTDKMNTKRRVLCVYDGKDQLWKDEMMLDNDCELRIRLPGGAGDGTHRDAYVTDLDVATLNRAVGVFSATEEERGPWLSGPANRLMGQPAMLLPELPHGQFMEDVDIDELIPNV